MSVSACIRGGGPAGCWERAWKRVWLEEEEGTLEERSKKLLLYVFDLFSFGVVQFNC